MVDNDGKPKGSEDEYYKQVKQKQEAKRAAKQRSIQGLTLATQQGS
ncbi:unnamed protein product [Arabidopsis halleri]